MDRHYHVIYESQLLQWWMAAPQAQSTPPGAQLLPRASSLSINGNHSLSRAHFN